MYKGFIPVDSQQISTNACLVLKKYRCGKSNCKCVRGYLHQSAALKYRMSGVQKMKCIRQADVERVRIQLYEVKGIEIIDRGGNPRIRGRKIVSYYC